MPATREPDVTEIGYTGDPILRDPALGRWFDTFANGEAAATAFASVERQAPEGSAARARIDAALRVAVARAVSDVDVDALAGAGTAELIGAAFATLGPVPAEMAILEAHAGGPGAAGPSDEDAGRSTDPDR
ncbi:MAG: hypothetical protein ACLGIR_11650 [Actinomycetes bacterium]